MNKEPQNYEGLSTSSFKITCLILTLPLVVAVASRQPLPSAVCGSYFLEKK